jgi:serine/threonine protein kinase
MSNYIATRWYRAPEVILGHARYNKAVDMWSVGTILAELIGRKPIFPGRDSFHQITLIVGVLGTPPAASNLAWNNAAGTTTPTAPGAGTGAGAATKPPVATSSRGPTDDYISALPYKPCVPFHVLYPKASPLACDLLDKLLCFDPESRLSVEDALAHPYLAELHCLDDEPVCTTMDFTDFYFEYLKCTRDDLRVLIHQEIVNHYREETFIPPSAPPHATVDSPSTEKKTHVTTSKANGDSVTASEQASQPLEGFHHALMGSIPQPNAGVSSVPAPHSKKGRRKSF